MPRYLHLVLVLLSFLYIGRYDGSGASRFSAAAKPAEGAVHAMHLREPQEQQLQRRAQALGFILTKEPTATATPAEPPE